jgi:hypothetical protein
MRLRLTGREEFNRTIGRHAGRLVQPFAPTFLLRLGQPPLELFECFFGHWGHRRAGIATTLLPSGGWTRASTRLANLFNASAFSAA